MKRISMTTFNVLLLISAFLPQIPLFAISKSKPMVVISEIPYEWVKSVHASLGVPSKTDQDTTNDYIMVKSQYVLSYNKTLNVCNWVAWELNASWFGDVARWSGNFISDTTLPAGMYRVKHSDYTNSGYDRGHMVMSEERTATVEENKSTFLITNVLPQRPDLNQGVWLRLETYCNDLCRKEDKELYIYAGGVFHTDSVIGNGVAVPDSTWKIVVVLEKGQTLNDVNVNTPVYSVMMPNQQGVRNDAWEKYITSVDQIELSTGYNFLSNVPESIQNVIESRIATSVDLTKNYKKLGYPNPFNDLIYIEKSIIAEVQSVECFNALGQKIELLTEMQSDKIVIITTELERGTYYLKIRNGIEQNTYSFIKD